MIEWRKENEVIEISKYSDLDLNKFVLYTSIYSEKITKIIEKNIDVLYDEVEKELKKIKEELKLLCIKHNNLVYENGDRKIINNEIYYLADNKNYYKIKFDEGEFDEGEFEYEYELQLLKDSV
jgi:hypothetical protein